MSTPLPPQPAAHEMGPGRLVVISSGRQLYCQELPGSSSAKGTGPTVVFEAGLASSRTLWAPVQSQIGRTHRAVAHDRAGLGRSPRTTARRRLADLAADLNEFLDELGPGPYLLVGHSWGGPIIRAAAAERPDRVQALVLVDPADEGCAMYFGRTVAVMDQLQKVLFPPLSHTGVLAALLVRGMPSLSEGARQDLRREMYTPMAVAAQNAAASQMTDGLRELQADARHRHPEVPSCTVISAGKSDIGAKNRRSLIEAHRRRAETFRVGRHVTAARSSHVVMADQPELIVEEIRRLLG